MYIYLCIIYMYSIRVISRGLFGNCTMQACTNTLVDSNQSQVQFVRISQNFSGGTSIAMVYSKYGRQLTFENFCLNQLVDSSQLQEEILKSQITFKFTVENICRNDT